MKEKILAAEDSKEVQDALLKVLGKNYHIEIVPTPDEAIDYDKPFDLVLADFTFYDKNGGKIKKQGLDIIEHWTEKRKGLPAILMTSNLTSRMIRACNEMGAGTFRKYQDNKTPINGEGLKKIIEEYMKK